MDTGVREEFLVENEYHLAWVRMSIVSSRRVLSVFVGFHGSTSGFRIDDFVQKLYQGHLVWEAVSQLTMTCRIDASLTSST